MKKQLLNALIAIVTVAPVLAAANPYFSGDVKLQDELIIFRDRVVCTGAMAALDRTKPTDPKDLINVEWTMGFAPVGDTNLMASGSLDGDLVSIQGNLNDGFLSLSVQQSVNDQKTSPAYSASTSGRLTKEHGVSLHYKRNGKSGFISCGFKK